MKTCCEGCGRQEKTCAGRKCGGRCVGGAFSLHRREREQPLKAPLELVNHGADNSFKAAEAVAKNRPDKITKHPGKRIVFFEMP